MLDSDVVIIATGGTIDKSYGVGAGVRDLGFYGQPAVLAIQDKVHVANPFHVIHLMSVDSLDMTDIHRQTIGNICGAVSQTRVLITHGTDTVTLTAKAIADLNLSKTIVLTCAGQPAVMTGTDADFNVGFAMCAVRLAPQGVYIAMNGELYKWDECEKNATSGVFTKKSA